MIASSVFSIRKRLFPTLASIGLVRICPSSGGATCKILLISEWIAKNPPGKGDGWEPYALSVRITIWIKFFLRHDKAIQESRSHNLYAQVVWLEKNVE